MTQRIISDAFWTDPYIEDLDPSEKLVFLYLLSNPLCNIAGAYEIRKNRIAYETGFDKDMIDKILNRFQKDGKILTTKNWIILVNFAKNQQNNPNVKKGMQRIIDSIPKDILKALKGFERLPYFTLLNLTLPNLTLLNSKEEEIGKEISIATKVATNLKDLMVSSINKIKIISDYNSTEDNVKKEMMEFYLYRSEKKPNGKKERWQMEKTFDVSRRFHKWLSNSSKWKKDESVENEKKRKLQEIEQKKKDLFSKK